MGWCEGATSEARHTQSQSSIERANQDLEHMTTALMDEKKDLNWSVALKFIQFQKNPALHAGISVTRIIGIFLAYSYYCYTMFFS